MTHLDRLGMRAIACPRWRWLPGMAFAAEGDLWRVQTLGHASQVHACRLPDLSDPATIGGLLALVREGLHGTVWVEYRPQEPWAGWVVWVDSPDLSRRAIGHADTEAGALVQALEAPADVPPIATPRSPWSRYHVTPTERSRLAEQLRALATSISDPTIIDRLQAIAQELHDAG